MLFPDNKGNACGYESNDGDGLQEPRRDNEYGRENHGDERRCHRVVPLDFDFDFHYFQMMPKLVPHAFAAFCFSAFFMYSDAMTSSSNGVPASTEKTLSAFLGLATTLPRALACKLNSV